MVEGTQETAVVTAAVEKVAAKRVAAVVVCWEGAARVVLVAAAKTEGVG